VTLDVEALSAALPSGLVALDFDGTLAAISPRPGDASPLGGAGRLLRDVRGTGAALAIVTGRTVASLLRVSGFDAVPGIVIHGTHGAERWQARRLRAPAPPAGLGELRASLPGLLAGIEPDLWLEDKGLSLVIHARLTPDPDHFLEYCAPRSARPPPRPGWASGPERKSSRSASRASIKGPRSGSSWATIRQPPSTRAMTSATCPLSAR